MSGVGNNLNTSQRNIPSGAPFTAGSAVNGLSVDATGRIVLGQDVGAVGNPAILLNNREIPMGGFSFVMTNNGFRKFLIDNAGTTYFIGDRDGESVGSFFLIDNLGDFLLGDQLQGYISVQTPLAGGVISIQMNGGSPNGMGFLLDGTNGSITMGDIFGGGNTLELVIDDANNFASIAGTFGVNQYLLVDIGNSVFTLGDLAGATSNTLLYLDNTTFSVQLLGRNVFDCTGAPNIYNWGDVAGSVNGTRIRINDTAAGADNRRVILSAINGVKITSTDGVLLHMANALTNGAAANVGTLNNAPAAGNPTKWVPIDDSGTTRFVPAW